MPRWDFRRESTQSAAGANTLAGLAKGYQAPFVAGDASETAEKRNVIATNLGWVRRENRSSVHGGTRTIEQVLVAANPGSGFTYNSNTFLGKPDISQIYIRTNANGNISANVSTGNLYVVFNTPINFRASGNLCSITITNTAGGNVAVARFANTLAQGRIVNANNTLVFRLPPMQGGTGNAPATYKVLAQSISVTGNPLYNPETGTVQGSANLVITGATSNNLSDGIGRRITTFTVKRFG